MVILTNSLFAVAAVAVLSTLSNNMVDAKEAGVTVDAKGASVDGIGVAALIELAAEYGAPFAETALERLHGNIFGSGRATRSTDVVVFNKSSKSFSLESNNCDHGGYSTDLFPEHEILTRESSVFGMESHGFATGVECTTRYKTDDGLYIELRADNPYIGSNSMTESCSSSLRLLPTMGTGDNNQVRWIIEDN